MGLESSNGFERNKATLLGGPFDDSPRLFPGFSDGLFLPGKRCLPLSRRTLKYQLLAFSFQLSDSLVPEPLPRFPANMQLQFASAASPTSIELEAES
jgi:hypothetical protein